MRTGVFQPTGGSCSCPNELGLQDSNPGSKPAVWEQTPHIPTTKQQRQSGCATRSQHPPPPTSSSPIGCDADVPYVDPRRARVEDTDDEIEDRQESGDGCGYWVRDVPERRAGRVVEASNLAHTGLRFKNIRNRQQLAGKLPWDPFSNEEEWELAQWLVETGVSQRNIDKFLKLKTVN